MSIDLETDLAHSREHEMRVYLNSMSAMYQNALQQNGEIYDAARTLTQDFTNITSEAILSDSRIIKVLRYAIAPSISQMKFGQFFGMRSIGNFEKDRLAEDSRRYNRLSQIAGQIADFTSENLDLNRFRWVMSDSLDSINLELASSYAKSWTCSLISDQNAQTNYRNWRKDQQELAIASELVQLGYTKSSFSGIVTNDTDIKIGEFTQELRVKGRTRQKADLIVRSKKTRKLVLIEAKAVGVEIDSTKRIKECCDKANDWRSEALLNAPIVVAVIAGFFNHTGIDNLRASEIHIVWEHRLSDLEGIL